MSGAIFPFLAGFQSGDQLIGSERFVATDEFFIGFPVSPELNAHPCLCSVTPRCLANWQEVLLYQSSCSQVAPIVDSGRVYAHPQSISALQSGTRITLALDSVAMRQDSGSMRQVVPEVVRQPGRWIRPLSAGSRRPGGTQQMRQSAAGSVQQPLMQQMPGVCAQSL